MKLLSLNMESVNIKRSRVNGVRGLKVLIASRTTNLFLEDGK